jgi:hypothetical protein
MGRSKMVNRSKGKFRERGTSSPEIDDISKVVTQDFDNICSENQSKNGTKGPK